MSERLPKWPDRSKFEARRLHTLGRRWEPREEREFNRAEYQMHLAEAALKRMEALEAVLRAILNSVPFSHHHAALARRAREAIAACERRDG